MFGRRTSDLPEARPSSAAALGASPLLASAADASPGGRAFGRRKDDETIRVMHMPKQAASDSGDSSRKAAPPTLVTRTVAPPPSLPAQRSHLESIKDRIHPKLMARMDVSAASAMPREELKTPIAALVGEILF